MVFGKHLQFKLLKTKQKITYSNNKPISTDFKQSLFIGFSTRTELDTRLGFNMGENPAAKKGYSG